VAALGTRKLNNPNPFIGDFELEIRPRAGGVPTGTLTAATVVGTLCAPAAPISESPIMPEGFLTYTNLMPSSQL
jgi:hypothetical protein